MIPATILLLLLVCVDICSHVALWLRLNSFERNKVVHRTEVLEDQLVTLQTQLGSLATRKSRARGTAPR